MTLFRRKAAAAPLHNLHRNRTRNPHRTTLPLALRRTTLVLLLATALTHSATAGAQQLPNTRMGFWIGLGVGGGSVGANCDVCSTSRSSSYEMGMRLGFALSPHFVLGGESTAWNPFDIEGESFSARLLTLAWYPRATGALFVKGGFGDFVYYKDNEFDLVDANGVAGMAGIGYDIRMKRNFSLTPVLMYVATPRVTTEGFGDFIPRYRLSVSMLKLGLGFTWH
jgi:hypothetical protein